MHEILHMHGLSNANEDCAVWANIKAIVACAHVISLAGLRSGGRQSSGGDLSCD